MPEGHTLHRLARRHREFFAGRRVGVSSPQGRFTEAARLLDGDEFVDAEAWGKHLLHRYASGRTVHIHLGIYGAFSEFTGPPPAPVGQVRMRLMRPGRGTDLRGPAACELVTEPEVDALLARLGPDPLRPEADPDVFVARVRRSRRAIGSLLMDQKVIAGVGNVYRAEVLFRAGLDPFTEGRRVPDPSALWDDLVELMPVGVATGVMHVVRAEHDAGAPSYSPDRPRTYVYRRVGEPCRVCGSPVATAVMETRNLFWCPTCQRGPTGVGPR